MTNPPTPLPPLDTEVARLVHLVAQVDQLTDQIDTIKARLRTELATGTHQLGGVNVQISVPRRFSPKLATAMLTEEQIAQIVTTEISATLARQVLPPAVYETLTVPGSPVVRVR